MNPLPTTILDLFCVALEREGFNYLITGSIASMIYGEPRFTHDVDMVIQLKEQELSHFAACFPESDYYFLPICVRDSGF